MSDHYDVLIVGGGHGGAQAAIALKQQKYEGTIAIISNEMDPPYHRPPLSKEYMMGDKSFERILLQAADSWAERDIGLFLGEEVTQLDATAQNVATKNGRAFSYGKLIWAAGGAPRRLSCPGATLTGVHVVRTRADADAILAELPDVSSVVVVGGGYIGLEAAAVLRKFDKHVTLLESLDRVLARVAGEPLSRFYEKEHRAKGVDIRLDAMLSEITGENGNVSGVKLEGGETIPAQMVIVGIGITPSIAPLMDAGAEGENGVRVDAKCQTNLENVFAIGDCAEHQNIYADDQWIRLESVQNANDQAKIAAQTICGNDVTYKAVPWFWSNQYDLRLQTAGLSLGYNDIIVRGDPDSRSFAVVYLRGGTVIALDCVNAPRDYNFGKALVMKKATPDRDALANPDIALNELK